ncbi:hypothetical protein GGS23DRAFT_606298 [Durotheca rogersii]|uniref:uncharacterized protein n=1 Tax=Durotheca rogersii TaxID=419775 RepID=UPI00221EBF74|nr:uncharacterized protein GGS23DRAFT_606298 [Durotheca rogersii]KAI5861428.1 hypothetical protein GGS23DRAFT_606298 [Durotheca rogersii]
MHSRDFLRRNPPVRETTDDVIPPAEEARIRLELAQQLRDIFRVVTGITNWRFSASSRKWQSSGRHPTYPDYCAGIALQLAPDLVEESLSTFSPETYTAILPSKVAFSRSSKRAKTLSGTAATTQKRPREESATRNEADAEMNKNRLATLMPSARLFGDRLRVQLLSQKIGSSDCAWNMLAANRQLHACQLLRGGGINLGNSEGRRMLDGLATWHGSPGAQSKDGRIVAASNVQP